LLSIRDVAPVIDTLCQFGGLRIALPEQEPELRAPVHYDRTAN